MERPADARMPDWTLRILSLNGPNLVSVLYSLMFSDASVLRIVSQVREVVAAFEGRHVALESRLACPMASGDRKYPLRPFHVHVLFTNIVFGRRHQKLRRRTLIFLVRCGWEIDMELTARTNDIDRVGHSGLETRGSVMSSSFRVPETA